MISSDGALIFLTKPISLFFLMTAAIVVVDMVTRKKAESPMTAKDRGNADMGRL